MLCACGTKLCKLKMVSDILDHPGVCNVIDDVRNNNVNFH